MKHHRAKGVWRHRPDELPIDDGPSTGSKRKKRPLKAMGNKLLGDLLKAAHKEVRLTAKWIIHDNPWAWPEIVMCHCDRLRRKCDVLDDIIREIEDRAGPSA